MHQDVHRGSPPALSGGNQGRGNRAGPAGQGLILHAAFVGPDAERVPVHDGCEIGIRPGRPVVFVVADRPAGREHIEPLQVVQEMDGMGNAGVDAVDGKIRFPIWICSSRTSACGSVRRIFTMSPCTSASMIPAPVSKDIFSPAIPFR